jgi:hypothetical protein
MLLIAGFAKCGTTSLFSYLSQHPDICASSVKETGFFVPTEEILREPRHPVPPIRFEQGWSAYRTYFRRPERAIWLEASNYARFAGSADTIRALCPDARLIFLVRNPLERVLSAYRYRQLVGTLPHSVSFEQYVQAESETGPQLSFGVGDVVTTHYSRFLQPFFDRFPPARLKLIGFHELAREPGRVLRDICRWLDIDERPVDGFDLAPENVTYHPRNWRVHGVHTFLRTRVWNLRRRFPRTVDQGTALYQRTAGKLYRRWNADRPAAVAVSAATRELFGSLYASETAALCRLGARPGLLEPTRPEQA